MNNSVIVTTLVVGGSTALRIGYDGRVRDKGSAWAKVAVGTFVLGAVLTLLGGAAPGVGIALAWLLCIAALMLNSKAILAASGRVLSTK